MLKVLDLFSGIGGFSRGLELTGGFETVGFCEIEPFCHKVLGKHWPEVPIFEDVRSLNSGKLKETGIAKVDVICGGFPCQDISVAGRQEGITGERSGLWSEFARLIDELRPDYAIIENVANLRNMGLASVLQDLWSLGYDAEWHIIPACAVGAPHKRERIWIIAYPNSLRVEGSAKEPILRESDIQVRQSGQPFQKIRDVFNTFESRLCRSLHGLPNGVHRVKSLGNTVIPQIPECIGHAIVRDLH